MGISYSKLIKSMKDKNIAINRKILSDLAISDNATFKKIVDSAINYNILLMWIRTFQPPLIKRNRGARHPIKQTQKNILDFLIKLGFEVIDGQEIETEEFNFDLLNVKKNHPARQMHDTFYVNEKSNLLRTHTSPVQIRGMLDEKPPLAFISGGKVYRKDDDLTHLFNVPSS